MSEKYLTSNEVMQFCDNLRNMSVPEALGTLGYTVVPDPPREPFGDVVVVDSQGNTWKRTPPVAGRTIWLTSILTRGGHGATCTTTTTPSESTERSHSEPRT